MNRMGAQCWRLAIAAACFALAGCHAMRPMEAEQLNSQSPSRIWVTSADQTVVELHAPRLAGDTLGGFVDGKYREMLLSETRDIKQLTPSPARTAILGVTVGVAALAGFVYMANRAYVGDGQTCTIPKDGTVVPCCAGKSTVAC